MSGARAWPRRLLLSAIVLALSLVLAEGLVSLSSDRSLLRLARESDASPTGAAPRNEAERRAASTGKAGQYAVHRDALVSYVLRPQAEVEVHGQRVHTDALGLRRRTGPEPGADSQPLRVVVLGDSIAFGFGLAEDEVIAEHLERRLTALRPGEGTPVLCRTVAVPGWNVRNQVSFLRDHWDELRPDIVVHVPCDNDLDDSMGVLESGFLIYGQDLAQADPWLSSAGTAALVLQRPMLAGRDEAEVAALRAMAGPNVLLSGLGPESARRYADNVRLLSDLDAWLDARGGHLLLACVTLDGYALRLALRLRRLPRPLPVLSLFSSIPPGMTLPDNPHPNARAAQAMGEWIADDLVARGWVAGRPDAPAATGPFDAHRGAPPEDEELESHVREAIERDGRALRAVVDLQTFEGVNQVYGTLNGDGSAGARLVLLLAPAGRRLELELAPLPQRPDLYPLEVEVLVDDHPLGRVTVPVEGPVRASFELPAGGPKKPARELRLVPARWVTLPIRDVPQIVSFVPRRFALGD